MASTRFVTILPWVAMTIAVVVMVGSLYRVNIAANGVAQEQAKLQAAIRKLKVLCVDVHSGEAHEHVLPTGSHTASVNINTKYEGRRMRSQEDSGIAEVNVELNRPRSVGRRVAVIPHRNKNVVADESPDNAKEDILGATPAPETPAPPQRPQTPISEAEYKRLPRVGIVTLNAQSGGGGKRIKTTHNKASWMYKYSFHNKYTYAKKWGYDLIIEDNDIVDKTRDVAWSKIPIWKKWLPKYQWLMWMDMDAFFMRYDIDLGKFLDDKWDVVIAKDFNGINMGVMFVRNSKENYELFERMWNAPKTWWHPWEEQSALMALLNPRKNTNDAHDIGKRFTFPPQRDINSYPGDFSYGHTLSMYKEGDFIAHFPNCKSFGACQRTVQRFYERSAITNDVKAMDYEPPGRMYPGEKLEDLTKTE